MASILSSKDPFENFVSCSLNHTPPLFLIQIEEKVMGLEWLIFIILVSIGVTLSVLGPHIMEWLKKPSPPSDVSEKQPASTPPATPTPMPQEAAEPTVPVPATLPVEKSPEYLANSHTREIHDLSNIKPACHIDLITKEHKVFFDNIEEAKKAMGSKGYDGCKWCLTQYHTD